MKTSSLLTLNWNDFFKSVIVAALSGGLATFYEVLQTDASSAFSKANLIKAGIAAVTAGIAYLIKNFFTDSTIKTPVTNETK